MECEISVKRRAISRNHCSIQWSGDQGVLVDLGSANGTYLNGQEIAGQSPLNVGDEVQIDDVRLQVMLWPTLDKLTDNSVASQHKH